MSKALSITAIRNTVSQLIAAAELICYPMGSFYSSLVANLLPRGVNRAIQANRCPKVYIPSTGRDPEVVSDGVAFQVAELLRHLRGGHAEVPASELLHYILVDSARGVYPNGIDRDAIQALGVKVVDLPLAGEPAGQRLDSEALAAVLASLV